MRSHWMRSSRRGSRPRLPGGGRLPLSPGQSEYVCLASLFEGGARRAEGVSCVSWECPIVRKTPPQSLRASMNRGMIATGNHGDFDSLRGAQPQRGRRGRLPFNEAPARRTRQVPLVGAAVPGCPAVGGCRCHRAKANTNPVPGRSGTPAPTRGGGFVRSHWVRSSRRGSRPRLPGGGRLPLSSSQSEYEPGARAVGDARPYKRRWVCAFALGAFLS